MKKMKKSVKILIITIIALLITGATVFAATIGKSTSSYVRIRQQATVESEILDVLMEGDQVEILGESGDWYKVSAKGHKGYVSKAFITKNGNSDNNVNKNDNNSQENQGNQNQTTENNNSTNENATQKATVTTKIYKVAEKTNVYILPILSSDVIGSVNAGEGLDLLCSAGLWGYIKTDKVKGWVRIDKLNAEEITVVTETTEKTAEETKQQENNNQENKQQENNNQENKQQESNNQENKQPENNNQENNQPENNNQQANNNETPINEKTMYVCVEAINVRAEANTTSEVISGAALNTSFTVVAESNGWYKVKVNGNNYGYIRKDLLSDNKTEETSRGGEVDRTNANNQSNQNSQSSVVVTTSANTVTNAAAVQQTNTAPAKSASGVTGADVAEYAKKFLNCRYVYGAAGPSSFDCSGLTMYVYKHFGYSLSHSSKVQATQGVKVTGELQPGDILVFSNDGKQVGHVGLYLGNDKFIHASDSTTGVIISNLHDSWNIKKYWGARRIIQ